MSTAQLVAANHTLAFAVMFMAVVTMLALFVAVFAISYARHQRMRAISRHPILHPAAARAGDPMQTILDDVPPSRLARRPA